MIKVRGTRALIMVPVLVTVLVATIWAFSYHTSEFKGGVGIRDSGLFYYPRYHAHLGDLPFWKNGEYQFTVHGLPPGPLDLELYVADETDKDRTELTSSSTSLSVSITEDSGKVICTATGKPSDGIRPSSWVLTGSSSDAGFWHERCLELPIS